jgi:hopanoid biosynthesis associated RND transporter like protein HpnN
VFAAERSLAAARETAERLGLDADAGIRVRITGYPALNQEEMAGLAKDTSLAGALSFLLVIAMLSFAFRSWRFVLAAALTLIAGIVWAAAFSAATIRVLNPISITFGILVIGLGIDFMIHLGMHIVDEIASGATVEHAIAGATSETGAPLVLCALTTGVGFLAFVPTDFRGVSDLGLAAAGGMVSTLILTLTLFPALIRLFNDPRSITRLARRVPTVALRIPPPRRPVAVVAAAATLGVAALALLPKVDLNTNVISIRNQQAESVQIFKELLEKRATTPWFLDALTPSLEAAEAIAEQLRALPTVDAVATIADFVPEAQAEKVEILGDIAMMLGLPPAALRTRVDPELQRRALEALHAHLTGEPLGTDHPLAANVRALEATLAEFLALNGGDGAARTRRLGDVLLDPIPDQIERLRANLDVHPITRNDLPSGLVERMLSADGHARIQAYPTNDLWSHDAMVEFVESIREIWPEITGLPVNLVESARATWRSLRGALLLATVAIAVLIFALWRNLRDTAIVICPLLLAVLLTVVSTVVLPISLNFGSVIVLPLLLGIGVDSGIHLVERARVIGPDAGDLLDSTTARAVLFSGFTTVASFGTLMISAHVGTASLGMLLVVGMAWTLAANLVLLPSLLTLLGTGGTRTEARDSAGARR